MLKILIVKVTKVEQQNQMVRKTLLDGTYVSLCETIIYLVCFLQISLRNTIIQPYMVKIVNDVACITFMYQLHKMLQRHLVFFYAASYHLVLKQLSTKVLYSLHKLSGTLISAAINVERFPSFE